MDTSAIYTVVKMMESLPESLQARVADHVRDYIDELRAEEKWDILYMKTQDGQAKAAQRARRQIQEGLSKPLDLDHFDEDSP